MIPDKQDFCFCTYAGGSTYRTFAKNLINDIQKYAPGISIIIFTDKPEDFTTFSHALVYKHERKGVLHYHERRFAIAKALSMFKSCMYIDADVRICAPFVHREWLPGITARSCCDMKKHFQKRMDNSNPNLTQVIRKYNFVKLLAQKIGIDLEQEEVKWIYEFLFVVTQDSGKELEFLEYWDKLALYCELKGLNKHPAYAMGLAATKAGLKVRHDVMDGIDFMDDRIEKIRISTGESQVDTKKTLMQAQYQIEYAKKSLFQKVKTKIITKIEYIYYYFRLAIKTVMLDYRFYYDSEVF